MMKCCFLLCAVLAVPLDARSSSRTARPASKSPPPSPPGPARPPRSWELTAREMRVLYILTVVNPTLSVVSNRYRSVIPVLRKPLEGGAVTSVYRTLFYFAKLKPRLLFVVGACLRALQQTTVLQLVFDPSAGVGAGLNLLAMSTSSRWPSALTLGWAASKPAWRMLGATPPGGAHVPISIRLSGGSR